LLGQVYHELGRYEDAVNSFEQAYSLQPDEQYITERDQSLEAFNIAQSRRLERLRRFDEMKMPKRR